MITDFTLLSVATIDPGTLTISEPELVRAHTVRRKVLNNEPLVVLNELEGEDMTEFYEYLDEPRKKKRNYQKNTTGL